MLISIFRGGGGAASAPPERHLSAMIFASNPDAATQQTALAEGEHCCSLEEVDITGHPPPAKGSLDLALKRRPSQVSEGTIFIRYGH